MSGQRKGPFRDKPKAEQSVILKGAGTTIVGMGMPDFDSVNRILRPVGLELTDASTNETKSKGDTQTPQGEDDVDKW